MLCIQRTSTGEGQLSACFVLGSHKLYFSLTIDVCLPCCFLTREFLFIPTDSSSTSAGVVTL